MRKQFDITVGGILDLRPEGLDKKKIKRVWLVYDEEKLWENNKFNPKTGDKIERGDLDAINLEHHEGVFLDDFYHDWRVSDGILYYYSHAVGTGERVSILIEFGDE